MMSIRQVAVSGFPAVALRAGEVELIAVPGLGMKLSNLRRTRGREWLWRNPRIPFAEPVSGASYVDTADSGGWDECFPDFHGELWSARWSSSVFEAAGAPTLSAAVTGVKFPYEFQRDISLDPHEPVARFRYRLRHTGDTPFPWLWAAHPLLNVQPGSVLELPGVSQVRVDAAHGRPDLDAGDHVSWPGGIGGRADRFEFPGAEAGWAAMLFADNAGSAVVTDPVRGERLEFRADPASVPQLGAWINVGGWAPGGAAPYYNLAVEPCIGGPGGSSQVLNPGEERAWGFEVRLAEEGE